MYTEENKLSDNGQPVEETEIFPGGSSLDFYLRELWRYRELVFFLAWRDVKVRYKQAVLGIGWSVLRPMITIAIFTILFGALARFPSNGTPYPVLVFAGLLPWQFFATGLSSCSESLVGNSTMITKIYFPRLIIPLSAVLASLSEFLISLALLGPLSLYYGFWSDPLRLLAIVPLTLLAFMVAFGSGIWFAALNVKYRDFRHITPFLIQIGFYVSPVGFSSSVIPKGWKYLYSLNPMVGIIEGYRWAILGDNKTPFDFFAIGISLFFSFVLIMAGTKYFRRTERQFADVI